MHQLRKLAAGIAVAAATVVASAVPALADPPTSGGKAGKIPTINEALKPTGFTRTIYDIVRYADTADHIPAYLNKFLGRTGYFCSDKTATGLLKDYGFLTVPTCGSVS